MKTYKHYKCKSCGKELYGVDPVCFYGAEANQGKVSCYICSSCKSKMAKGPHVFRAFTSYSGVRKRRH